MTFLNPLMLFGLAAAAIPILLHLLNLRKLRTVDFSSLRFLRELQRTRIRRIRLRQWILLLLRTLLVLSLVLAFARPALRGSLAGIGGSNGRSAIILLVDDSPSMGLRNAGGILLDQARAAARQIIALARPGDEVAVIPLSSFATADTGRITPGQQEALARTDRIRPTNTFTSYDGPVRRALALLRSSAAVNRELYLLTDLQASHFPVAQPAPAADPAPPDDARLFLVSFEPDRRENSAVVTATVESRILAQNRPVTVRATVRNFGDRTLANSVVSLYIEGTRVAQRSVTIPPNGRATVDLTGVPRRRGVLGCSVRIEDDLLDIDNRRWFSLAVPETVSVLLAGPGENASRFAALALSLAGDSSVAGLFRVTRTTDERLATASIEGADVLVLTAPAALPASAATRIVASVRNGMGLMVFAGPGMDAPALARLILEPLGIPPLQVPAPAAQGEDTGFLRFGTTDLSHPLFAGMFEHDPAAGSRAPAIESPRITTAATIRASAPGVPVVAMSDGRPFLADYRAGTGRVLLCAVDAGTAWSDFAVRGLFAPLVHRSMAYLAAAAPSDTGATVGDQLSILLPRADTDGRREFIITAPDGSDERILPAVRPGGLLFTSAPAEMPGLYTLRTAEASAGSARPPALRAAAVNPHPAESDLQAVTAAQLAAFLNSTGVAATHLTRVDDRDAIERTVRESRFGVELWHLFVGLALVCALLEMIIARASRRTLPEGTVDA